MGAQPSPTCKGKTIKDFLFLSPELQAYIRFAQQHDGSRPAHGLQLWGSILRAKGFLDSFAAWWFGCPHKVHGSPTCVPFPPCADVATALFDSVVLAFRSLERDLIAASKQYAKFRHQRDPKVIFRDLKSATAQGV